MRRAAPLAIPRRGAPRRAILPRMTKDDSPGRSLAERVSLRCPRCGARFEDHAWLIIDIAERPDLLERVTRETIHAACCPRCGATQRLQAPLLLHDPATQRLIFAMQPGASTTDNQRIAQELGKRLIAAIPPEARSPYLTRAIIVADLAALRVALMEDAASDDLSAALPALMHADSSDAVRALLVTHPVLATAEARAYLHRYLARLRTDGHTDLADALRQRLIALDTAADSRLTLIQQLIEATGPEQRAAILDSHSIDPEVPAMLEALATQARRRGLEAVARDLAVMRDEARSRLRSHDA